MADLILIDRTSTRWHLQVICSLIIGVVVTLVRWTVLYWMIDFKVRPDRSPAENFFLLLLLYEAVMQVMAMCKNRLCICASLVKSKFQTVLEKNHESKTFILLNFQVGVAYGYMIW